MGEVAVAWLRVPAGAGAEATGINRGRLLDPTYQIRMLKVADRTSQSEHVVPTGHKTTVDRAAGVGV